MKNKVLYFGTIILGGVIALLYESDCLPEGVLAMRTDIDFYIRTVLELASLVLIYIALKCLAMAPRLRILMLGAPYIVSVISYYIFVQPTYAYIALILVICMVFVYPRE